MDTLQTSTVHSSWHPLLVLVVEVPPADYQVHILSDQDLHQLVVEVSPAGHQVHSLSDQNLDQLVLLVTLGVMEYVLAVVYLVHLVPDLHLHHEDHYLH